MNNAKSLILLLPAAVAIFWFVIIFFSIFKKNKNRLALSFFMLSVAMSLYPGYLFFVGKYVLYEKLYVATVFFALSQFPAFYNYLVSITSERSNPKIFYLKHWIMPLTLTILAFFIQYKLLNVNDSLYFVEHVLTGKVEMSGKFEIAFIIDKVFKVIFVLSSFFYFHLINKRVNDHEEQILDYFSNTDEISFEWFKIFKITFFFAFISGIFFHSLDRSFHMQHIWLTVIAFSLLSIFYWVVGFFGNRQIDIYKAKYDEDIISNHLLQVSDTSVDLDEVKISEIANSLDSFIKNKQLYLNKDLTLIDLALMTRIDRNKILYVIKNHMGTNFNSYINEKRVNYAKKQLRSNRIISFNKIYEVCGFQSKDKFCDIFREFTGKTPMEYRNKILLRDTVSYEK